MTTERWIVIPNWDGPEGFQHYRDRTPIWIKNYVELLHDSDYLGLTGNERGVLHGLWLEYASARRAIRDDPTSITRRLGIRVTRLTLDALNHAGFITFSASKPLAPRYQDASDTLAQIKSREEKKEDALANNTKTYDHACPECGAELKGPRALQEHRYRLHAGTYPTHWQDPVHG